MYIYMCVYKRHGHKYAYMYTAICGGTNTDADRLTVLAVVINSNIDIDTCASINSVDNIYRDIKVWIQI